MSDYSYNDMLRMQSEAKQRVLEMQKRSRTAAENFQSKSQKCREVQDEQLPSVPKAISFPADIRNVSSTHRSGVTHKNNNSTQFDLRKSLYNVFGNLTGDDYERMFIMSLCLLLAEENRDDSLIFALMYLLT
ncbi:MAG: hypothetical protein E7573_01525 [Ruminococcaceae bacterium]|nr:hypothetical protein [Oscillospiraceae bacterium]MBR3597675.1 hypothetical protein [Clostridia bacterium]